MSDEFDDIQAIFFEECLEGLSGAEAAMASVSAGDREALTVLFRVVHSIKGGAGAFGHGPLTSFAHEFENVLDALRSDRLAFSESVSQICYAAFDLLSDHVAAARTNGNPPEDDAAKADLKRLLTGDAPAADPAVAADPADDDMGFAPVAFDLDLPIGEADAGPAAAGWTIRFRPSRSALANGGEPLLLMRELELLGGVAALDSSALPAFDDFSPDEAYLGWTVTLARDVPESELREVFDFLDDGSVVEIVPRGEPRPDAGEAPVSASPPAPPAPVTVAKVAPAAAVPAPKAAPAAARNESATVRIDVAKLDLLLDLVGELVIRNSILSDRLSPRDQERVELPQFARLVREVQDSVMALRAQPLRSSFSRVPRLVRELGAETGKQVRLEVVGDHIEVDKSVIERIGDPLTHMIRNAVDHGIEPLARRLAAGKAAEGVIRVVAEQRGARILITVSDDGGGIDRVRVRALAEQRGLVTAEQELTDAEIDTLICAPGFSTAEAVSNISGRGVGMDVVRSNVEALGGRVDISSVPGQGTSVSLMLPLTLAIMDGMIVRIAGQRFVIPLSNVIETVEPEPGQIRAVTTQSEVIDLRGNYVPVQRVAALLALGANDDDVVPGSLVVVVETSFGQRAGLIVDTIEDRREIAIKSLERNLHPIDGLAGATILGDGTIAFILDIDTLAAPAITAGNRAQRELAA